MCYHFRKCLGKIAKVRKVKKKIKTHDSVSCGQVQPVRESNRQVCILQEPSKHRFYVFIAQ